MARRTLLMIVAVGAMIGIVALAPSKDQPKLLILEWSSKAKPETPPLAILIEMGLKDTEPADWSGRATAQGAKVVHREGYRFRKGDELKDPDAWEAKSHRPIRVPPRNQPAVVKAEGIAGVGVVLHLTDVQPDATLKLEAGRGGVTPPLRAEVSLKAVQSGKPQTIFDGSGVVRRVTAAAPLTNGKTEDDFPAACYDKDGRLWVAYISYTLKDETRRVEQTPYKEQPENFKSLNNPDFGDQLWVKYYHAGKWSQPVAVTGPKEDLLRCAVAAEGNGDVWVAYSANRKGNYDIYARKLDLNTPDGTSHPKPNGSPEQRLTHQPGPDLSPVLCTHQHGALTLFHAVLSHIHPIALQQIGQFYRSGRHANWLNNEDLRAGLGSDKPFSSLWSPAVTAAPWGKVAMVFDAYRDGDYDLHLHITDGDRSTRSTIASTSRFEARPSVCYDPKGRLWIAYEEGPEKWGKDYGAFDDDDGNPLYNTRNVRVVCIDVNGKLMKPAAELPMVTVPVPKPNRAQAGGQPGPNYERTARYSSPAIGIDGKGRVWLSYRVKYGSRYSTHAGSYWLSYARRLDGDKWSEPIEIHHSDGLLDYRPVILPHVNGGIVIVHNSDGRYTEPETVHNRIYVSHLDLPGEPVEPKLVPHEPGTKNPELVKEAERERETVNRIRAYRVEAGDKKYHLLRGEFHRHTEMSWDGGPDGSLEDMFRYAIDAAGMDWIGNGDHDNGAGREYSWWLTQKLTDAYHVPGVFTPMFTYERSVAFPHGHRNCMFAQRGVMTLPRLAQPDMEKRVGGVHADDAKMLYRYLHEFNGICAMHTSATGMGTDWRDNDPVVEPIVEIYQGCRMSYEYPGTLRAGYDPKGNDLPAQIGGWQPEGFIDNAFQKGYRLGFQASSDHWSTHISYCIVLAEKRDRQSILDGLKKRHCYGATDDIILDVRSGNHVMGDEFKTATPPTLDIRVIGTKELARVDIIKDSKVVETIKPGKREYQGTWTDKDADGKTHYYYVRVEQTDGELAWGSPMWVTCTEKK